MKLHFVLFLLVLSLSINCSAQVNPGARQIAMAHSGIALADDVFSIFNNPSGSAQINWSEIGLYFSPAPFGLKELSNVYAAFHQPTSLGSFSLGFMTYGFDLYKETHFAISYSLKVTENFFAGITASYQNLSIERYGDDAALAINLGGLFYLRNDLRIGFAISNLNRATYGSEQNQIPVSYAAGISFDVNNNLSLNSTILKELSFPAEVNLGIEYHLIKYIDLRFGLNGQSNSFSSGIGINYSFLQFDYAIFNHTDLGLTHQVGLIVQFGEDKPRSEKIKEYLKIE